jgi:3-oxoacyl-[acyl-carrier-protein] synthase-3
VTLRITRFTDVWISGLASHIPDERVTTAALAAEIGADSDDLVRLTGVLERPVAPPEHATSDLVTAALRPLVTPESYPLIDRLIVATVTPDHPSPATAPLVQHALGLPTIPAYDLSAACAGFVFALDAAARALATGDRAVLVGAGECRVRSLTRATPGVRVLFGDGAAGALLTAHGPPATSLSATGTALRVLATGLGADGSGHAAVRVEAGGSRLPASAATLDAGLHALRMDDGAHVFMKATESFVTLADEFLGALGVALGDVALVVPHQPNVRILERVARLLRIPRERLVITADRLGNTGGASVALAVDQALRKKRVHPGDRILLLTAGAGYTAGAALLEAAAAAGGG